jgi:HK97 family phage major capsid protein
MDIEVILIATNERVTIKDTDFDESLHKRIDDTVGGMNSGNFLERMGEIVGRAVGQALETAGAGQVDRTRVAAVPGDGTQNRGEPDLTSALAGAHCYPGWERQYDSLTERERRVRTPEGDLLSWMWARAYIGRDRQALMEVYREIHDKFGIPGQRAAAPLTEGTDGGGGYLVPTPLSNTITTQLELMETIGPRAELYRTTAQTLKVPGEGASKMVATGVLEEGTIPEDEPEFSQVTLTKQKATCATRSSIELIEDTPFNLVSILSRQAAEALATYNDTEDATGNGTPPAFTDGLLNNSSIAEVDAAVGTPVYGDLTAIWYALKSPYRAAAYWMADGLVISYLAGVVATDGRPLLGEPTGLVAPLTGGNGAPGVGTIFGRPILEVQGWTTGNLMLGDLRRYATLQDPTLRVAASDQLLFLSDQIIWKFVQRRDGAVTQAEAFKKSGGITA